MSFPSELAVRLEAWNGLREEIRDRDRAEPRMVFGGDVECGVWSGGGVRSGSVGWSASVEPFLTSCQASTSNDNEALLDTNTSKLIMRWPVVFLVSTSIHYLHIRGCGPSTCLDRYIHLMWRHLVLVLVGTPTPQAQ